MLRRPRHSDVSTVEVFRSGGKLDHTLNSVISLCKLLDENVNSELKCYFGKSG